MIPRGVLSLPNDREHDELTQGCPNLVLVHHMEEAGATPPPHNTQPYSSWLSPQVLWKILSNFFSPCKTCFSQMDSEREHATSTRGFHSGCRKMEKPKLVSCCKKFALFTLLILPQHSWPHLAQPEQLPDDGERRVGDCPWPRLSKAWSIAQHGISPSTLHYYYAYD